jgi:hypothetical protein
MQPTETSAECLFYDRFILRELIHPARLHIFPGYSSEYLKEKIYQ